MTDDELNRDDLLRTAVALVLCHGRGDREGFAALLSSYDPPDRLSLLWALAGVPAGLVAALNATARAEAGVNVVADVDVLLESVAERLAGQ